MSQHPDEPASSAPFPATAVEIVHAPPPAGFAHGIALGVAAAAVLVHLWLGFLLAPLRAMYASWASYTPASLGPAATWFVSRPWLWGMPAVGAAAIVALAVVRPRRLWPYALVALVLVASAVGTYYAANAPVLEMAGTIKSE